MKSFKRALLCSSLGLFALSGCSYNIFDNQQVDETDKPFIAPVEIANSQCSSAVKTVKPLSDTVLEAATEFDFNTPFALPDDIISKFHYPITTKNKDAQHWFDIGMTHMANFNHDEAIAAFREAQTHDADCAMCYWGEGLSFGSNINAPFDPARGGAGLLASQKATARLDNASAQETALINALSTRYDLTDTGNVIENAAAYADAMDDIASQHAADKVILSLAAEANMNTQPWDYWQPGARIPKGRTGRTIDMLETALNIDPDFAPAIHLYIHATEASVDPFRARSYADTLAEQALGVGHLVHMPSHIYLRLGDWKNSHKANIQAINADEDYIANSSNAGFYSQTYYPHNVHFIVANSQLGGDGETALEMSDKLKDIVKLDPATPNPFGEHIAAAPLFSQIQFGQDNTVLNAPEPPSAHLFHRAAWHYTRGIAFIRQADLTSAKQEISALQDLSENDAIETYDTYGVPVSGIVEIAILTLKGRLKATQGDLTTAIALLDEAADKQDQLSYMEPSWWYYQTRQTLGALLIQDGQSERAEREFYRTLMTSPNNAYALYGLAQAFDAQGDIKSRDYAMHLFEQAWIGEPGQTPSLADL